jgi:16S rRNA (cytosine1402-N4)-methyltransferase
VDSGGELRWGLAGSGGQQPQLDVAERGFSFQNDGPLDMRMDTRQPVTAATLLNTESAEEIARIFWEYGDERESRRFARAIVHDRETRPFTTTRQLAELIERLSPRGGRKAHPATRVFQALRIAVNDEIGSLERGLDGRAEDFETRRSAGGDHVSQPGRPRGETFRAGAGSGLHVRRRPTCPSLRTACVPEIKLVSRKAIMPGEAELAENPRSRSAQLRVMEKI